MTQVRFDDNDFRRSHGRAPSRTARGSWAFCFDRADDVWFAPSMSTLAEAKSAARTEAQRRGATYARVQP